MSAESAYKNLSEFIRQFANSCISVLKVLVRSGFSNSWPADGSKTCIVLGNGPSLKTTLAAHKDYLKQNRLFCVNSFSLSAEFTELKPSHYVILDHSFWKSDGAIVLDSLEAIRTKTSWPMTLFVPNTSSGSERFKALAKANPNVRLQVFNYTVFKGFPGISHWFYKKNLAMPQSQNVLVASLFLALNSGFKEIYILGADHTWHEHLHVDENNVLNVKDVHFYDNEEKIVYRPFKLSIHQSETFKVHEIFNAWAKVFHGYALLENYSRSLKSKIYNASELSFIDAFERKKLQK